MPVGLTADLPELFPIKGIRLAAVYAGIKKNPVADLVALELAEGSVTAAVFTKNAACAAPVLVAKDYLAKSQPRALLINSGNANAATGDLGKQNAEKTCKFMAQALGIKPAEVLPFSTGVIGEHLPTAKFEQAIPQLVGELQESNWEAAAKGIMTTDIVPKAVSRKIQLGDAEITLTGIAKGSGMIHPNMATMLGFVATDAKVSQEVLQHCLTQATNSSFNRITVDGDTSTNDSCTLTATQQADMPVIDSLEHPLYADFEAEVTKMMQELAQMIVRDGEGATKFMEIKVVDAANEAEALKIAQSVALSPLVKTAFFASDPNWGRILAAVGKVELPDFDIEKVNIQLGEVTIVEKGGRAASYQEEMGQKVMDEKEITVTISLGRGVAEETVWTCDFSYDYVKINAEYRS